jgi:hypothetical protein
MNTDITFCNALFCPLAENCRRKEYIGRPCTDEVLSFDDFSPHLTEEDNGEVSCEAGLSKD